MRRSPVVLLLLVALAPAPARAQTDTTPADSAAAPSATTSPAADSTAGTANRVAAPVDSAALRAAARADSLAAEQAALALRERRIAGWVATGGIGLLAVGSVFFVVLAALRMWWGEEFEITSHWGGFGGGLGGWRLSPPLVLLAAGVGLALMLSVVAASILRGGVGTPAGQSQPQSTTSTTATTGR